MQGVLSWFMDPITFTKHCCVSQYYNLEPSNCCGFPAGLGAGLGNNGFSTARYTGVNGVMAGWCNLIHNNALLQAGTITMSQCSPAT